MADRERLALPAEDHLLVGDQPGQPHRVDRLVDVPPASRISSAVRFAVPEGASTFWSRWSSMISASGMCGAICFEASIISTAPIAKFGATKQFALPPAAARSLQLLEVESGAPDDSVYAGADRV